MASEDIDPALQAMIAARKRPAVMKIRFATFRSAFPRGLILAVEGGDDKIVYSRWVARTHPDLAYEFFVCDGKRSAAQLRSILLRDEAGLSEDVLILVDRDYDDLSQFEDVESVHMLERYSVENYLVESGVLNEVLQVAFPCHGQPDIRAGICALFEDLYADFLAASRSLNLRIYIGRQCGQDLDGSIPKSITDIAEVRLKEVIPLNRDPVELLPFGVEPTKEEVNRLTAAFDALNPQERYRGKFALKFFKTWLDLLAKEYRGDEAGLFGPPEAEPSKVKHEEFGLGALASRSPMPLTLSAFLEPYAAA